MTLITLGALLILGPNPGVLFEHMFGQGNWPSVQNLVFGIAIAALCFTGVETMSQLAEETRRPAERIPRAYVLMIVAVLILFAGISLVALSAMTPQILGDPVGGWARDPVAGIAANLPSPTLQSTFAPLVAVLAASILLTATNAGLMGISRLTYNMSSHNQLPAVLGRVHHRFKTPYIAIILFCAIALLLLNTGFFNPRFFTDLGALYVFGSLLCFALAHASILSLRTGYNVLFIKASRFLSDLGGGRADDSWEKRLQHYLKPNLLILDNFALKEFTKTQAEDLYELIDQRHHSSSMIVTANRAPKDWYPLFPNPVIAESALDRLVSCAHVITLTGKSYRSLLRPDKDLAKEVVTV